MGGFLMWPFWMAARVCRCVVVVRERGGEVRQSMLEVRDAVVGVCGRFARGVFCVFAF